MRLPYRKSPRLRGFDYSQPGLYFITICTDQMQCVLSRITVGEELAPPDVQLLPFGEVAEAQIQALSNRYPCIRIIKHVIMPNHIHMILQVSAQPHPEGSGGASPSPTVIDVVRSFKSLTTRMCKVNGHLFQRSFHDHIIRTENDYRMIWQYIDNNPAKWAEDRFYCE